MKQELRMTRLWAIGGLLLSACNGSAHDAQLGNDGVTSAAVANLFINELQPSNKDTVTDEKGEADDWIEILNAGDGPVDMVGISFADSSGTTQAIAASLVVPAGAFQLFWADDSPSQGANHLGFKLGGKAGDRVTLEDASGRLVDEVSFGPTTGQDTYARFPDGTGAFVWCAGPTPGAHNGAACAHQ
jgi:hypothetical protein